MLVNRVLSLFIITLSFNLLSTHLKQELCDKSLCCFIKTLSEKLKNNCKLVQKERVR
jgi:hypothetical protein